MIRTLYNYLTPTVFKRRAILRPMYESPSRAVVESTGGWRQLKRGEKDARLVKDQVLLSSWRCEVCGIGIGPGYNQEYMYLYPVYQDFAYHPKSDDKPRFYSSKTLKICGECACHPSRQLPEWLCVLTPEIYGTTALLCEEGETPMPLDLGNAEQIKQMVAAIREYIDTRHYFIYLLHLLCFNVSLNWFYQMMAEKEKKATPRLVTATSKVARVTSGIWNHITAPPAPLSAEAQDHLEEIDRLYASFERIKEPLFPESTLFL